MPIVLPTSPSAGDTVTAGGSVFRYTGTTWVSDGARLPLPETVLVSTADQSLPNNADTRKLFQQASVTQIADLTPQPFGADLISLQNTGSAVIQLAVTFTGVVVMASNANTIVAAVLHTNDFGTALRRIGQQAQAPSGNTYEFNCQGFVNLSPGDRLFCEFFHNTGGTTTVLAATNRLARLQAVELGRA